MEAAWAEEWRERELLVASRFEELDALIEELPSMFMAAREVDAVSTWEDEGLLMG